MNSLKLIAAVIGLTIAVSLSGPSIALTRTSGISITASANTFTFTPSRITVPVGKPATLHLTSNAGTHSIASGDLGISPTTIEPGKFVDVTFTPSKTGTFVLHCGTYCGVGHAGMMLTVVVTQR